MQLIAEPRFGLAAVLLFAAACSRAPQSPLADLAAKLPSDSIVIAGADLDKLRASPLYSKLPEAFRQGSYVLAGYTGTELVTATRSGRRVEVSGTAGQGAPADLLAHASDAPLWVVAHGSATLPLSGNLANVNRLLHQTEFMVVAARPAGDGFDLRAEGICRGDAEAEHLEGNARAIGSLMRFPMEVTREGPVVRVRAVVSAEQIGKVF
jgi:hypothetical protein